MVRFEFLSSFLLLILMGGWFVVVRVVVKNISRVESVGEWCFCMSMCYCFMMDC